MGNLKHLLRTTKLHVVTGNFSEGGQQRGPSRLIRGDRRRGGRFDRSADATPKINLPGRVEATLINIECRNIGAGDAACGAAEGTVGAGGGGNGREQAVVAG